MRGSEPTSMPLLFPPDLRDAFLAEYERASKVPPDSGRAPHDCQERLHTSRSMRTVRYAANRLGKSWAGMREVLWRATMTHPYREPKPINVVWCGFPSFAFFRETTGPHFFSLMPRDRLIQFNQSEFWAKV